MVLILHNNKYNDLANANEELEEELAAKEDSLINQRKEIRDIKEKYKKIDEELSEQIKKNNTLEEEKSALESSLQKERKKNTQVKSSVSRDSSIAPSDKRDNIFEITAYDLSVQSCGKSVGSSGYGQTASGFNLSGHTWQSARTVAADTNIYPFGTKLKLTFLDPGYEKYNGVYTVRDRGGAIKGRKLDFFMGDFKQNATHQNVWNFGRRKVQVEVVN